MHIALLGDSTFDNGAYTGDGPDVVAQMNDLLVGGDHATLLAEDGAMIDDIYDQIDELAELIRRDTDPVTHVALSVGGNDLLAVAEVLGRPVGNVGEALLALREEAIHFGEAYLAILDELLGHRLPTVVCTVYGGAFLDPIQAAVIDTALRIFDHEIVEAGLVWDLPIVDLRRVCASPADYWNPIEPNERGGAKIASALVAAFRAPRYEVGGTPVTLQGTGGMAQ